MSAYYRKKPAKGAPQSKADRRQEAEDVVAAFFAAGGTVKRLPSEEPTAFSCSSCGHSGIVGVTPGKNRQCPKCRAPLSR
jgi:hypothetical protein